MEYYAAYNKNEMLPLVKTWVDLAGVSNPQSTGCMRHRMAMNTVNTKS